MIMNLWLIDFLVKLSINIGILTGISLIMFVTTSFLSVLYNTILENESKNFFGNYIKKAFIAFLIFLSLEMIIPSPKTIYLMLSVDYIQNINANEKVSSLTEKSIKLIEKKLDEFLKEDNEKGK